MALKNPTLLSGAAQSPNRELSLCLGASFRPPPLPSWSSHLWLPSPASPPSFPSFFLSHPTGPLASFFLLTELLLCGFSLPFLSPGLQLFLSSTEASVCLLFTSHQGIRNAE